jgi:MFS family permease
MKNIWSLNSLFVSLSFLLAGHGLQLTLVPLKAQSLGWTPFAIGLTGSAYFLGFTVGCLSLPSLLYRVGHIRVHTVMASIATVALLLISLSKLLLVWIFLRFVTGWVFAGLYMVIESWLNGQIESADRGIVLSLYTLVSLLAIGVGQYLLILAPITDLDLFILAAVLLCLSIVPIGLTRLSSPEIIQPLESKPLELWRRSHVAVVGTFIAGVLSGSYWALGAVYASRLGIESSSVGTFMGGVVIGGALIMLPIGKASDCVDRRKIILLLAGFGIVVCLLASLLVRVEVSNLIYIAPFFGMAFMPLYSLCLAHANDHSDPATFVQTASAVLMISSVGSILGPLSFAPLMSILGTGALFDFSTVGFLLLAAWCAYRMYVKHAVDDDLEPFVAVTKTSPAAAELDPRGGH